MVCLRLYRLPKHRESAHSVWRFVLIFFCLLPPFKVDIDLVFQLGSLLSKISGLPLSESQRTPVASRFVFLPALRITALLAALKSLRFVRANLCSSEVIQGLFRTCIVTVRVGMNLVDSSEIMLRQVVQATFTTVAPRIAPRSGAFASAFRRPGQSALWKSGICTL